MPFKLKLKKSRQYNVTSKSLFVISVHHLLVLDTPTTVDCTLSSESTGQECLDNVCQRLSINQLEFFGLRFVVKGTTDQLRWVDLERPLSRQLDKYAASPKLYLRVMYYVISGVTLITDEIARNYYFLQLKSDVVENRISCDPKQAVILAMYCRQAQYDSHQSERHTVDYLKTLLPFPKHLIEAGLLETLTKEVLQPNAEIQNLTQAAAEGLFIAVCQQLDGYGQEKFPCKDDCGVEVTLGITVSGIAVSAGDNSKFYPWHEISNVVNHKRTFNIECTAPENSVGFTLSDTETGRYFWKLCVLQHTFYMKYEQNLKDSRPEANYNIFHHIPEDINESIDNLFVIDHQSNNVYASDSHISAISGNGSNGGNNWQTDSVVSSSVSLIPPVQNQHLRPLNQQQSWATGSASDYSNHNSNWGLVGSNDSLNNRAQSSSCLDLSNNNSRNNDREKLKAFLPGYRSAPDYETAVQQKYRTSETELRINPMIHVQNSAIVSEPHINIYSGSQPDVHRATAVADAIFGQQLKHQYPDVTQTTANTIYKQNIVGNAGGLDGLAHQIQMMRFNKPPPPYPANRLSSTSTPDLALASHRAVYGYGGVGGVGGGGGAYVSGSSPDLVSTRTFLNPQYLQQPNQPQMIPTAASNTFRYRYSSHIPHGTYENLNFMEPQTKANLLSQKIQKAYEGVYRVAPTVQQPPPQSFSNNLLLQQHNGSIEPIYENVPLPRQSDGGHEMRDRASSIQSAPGVMRPQQHQESHNFKLSSTNVSHENNQTVFMYPSDAAQSQLSLSTPATTTGHQIISKSTSNPIDVNKIQISNASKLADAASSMQQTNLGQKGTSTVDFHQVNSSSSSSVMNRSQSANLLDSSHTSNSTNLSTAGTATTTTNDSGVSFASLSQSKDIKKKKRWGGFFGSSSSSKSSLLSSDKLKSATLGRGNKDKSSKVSSTSMSREEENNLRHRWSTGLPRLPLPATISKEKLSSILETKLSDPQLYIEFEAIPKRKDNATYECALLEENSVKNVDSHFLPYDDNRVRLTPTRDNRYGYVNASHITATVGTKQRFYIIAQSPSNNSETLNTFFQCVWEADVYLLIQLSDEVLYVPSTNDKCLEYGQYQVWQEFSQVTDRCVTSKLRIYHTSSRRYRSVWHLRYLEWAEQNCPKDVGEFLEFLEELNSVRLASVNEVPPGHNTNPPVLIHCSEGGGRASVTLAADLLLYTLDHNQDLDIQRVISQLRQQRDNVIPSLAQYKFIYALIIHYLKRSRLI